MRRVMHRQHDAGDDLHAEHEGQNAAERPPVVQVARGRIGDEGGVDEAHDRQPPLEPLHEWALRLIGRMSAHNRTLCLIRLAGHPIRAANRAPSLPRRSSGGGRTGRIRPGEGQRRRIPAAFYWHPCRESASVGLPARTAGLDGTVPSEYRPCASPFISPISRRTPEPCCGCARALESRNTSLRLPVSRPPTARSTVPAWTISMP